MIHNDLIQSMILPKTIELQSNLFCLSFHVMKILPAYYIIHKALKENKIDRETEIIETSSGSFAYGVALACHAMGLKYHIITDAFMEPGLQRQIAMLGGNVYKARRKEGLSSQVVRMNLLERIQTDLKKSFWTSQYHNHDNSDSYQIVGKQIIEEFGKESPIILVGPVGSGGSTCGIISELRKSIPDTYLIGVDCFNSVLFGQPNGKRRLGGFGNGILPQNLKHEYFDEIHWLSDEYCIFGMQSLFQKHSMFCGHTTGAAYLVAKWIAEKYPSHKVIFISPDSGHRYNNTYYNGSWLKQNNFILPNKANPPSIAFSPTEAKEPWSSIKWNRRAIQEAA